MLCDFASAFFTITLTFHVSSVIVRTKGETSFLGGQPAKLKRLYVKVATLIGGGFYILAFALVSLRNNRRHEMLIASCTAPRFTD